MNAFREEWNRMTSGKYAITAIIVPLVVAAVFGFLFSKNQINESNVAVIDEDNSLYSKQLIDKINASQYMHVSNVYHQAVKPEELLYNEKNLAVLFLPQGLEQNRYLGKQSNIGFFIDNSIPAANGNIRTAISEVLNTENASSPTVGRLRAMGMNDDQVAATLSNLSLQQRLLFNPTNDNINLMVIGYVTIVCFSSLLGTSAQIVPRLRQEGRLLQELQKPFGLLLRIMPYVIATSAANFLAIGLLKQVGGFRFVGSAFEFLLPVLLFFMTSGWLGMLVGWTAATPQATAPRMTAVIMPTFMLSGIMAPLALFPSSVQLFSNILPASWFFRFVRGMGLRGGELKYFGAEIGAFLVLAAVFIGLLFLLMLREAKRAKRDAKAEGTELHAPAAFHESTTV
ncbi:MAG TPA: ABC transporter permease [Candidatus Bathyarchaeia archaeon]|nr:ABC transporter permease [Candidatus Bathyarchaeia archaeon]